MTNLGDMCNIDRMTSAVTEDERHAYIMAEQVIRAIRAMRQLKSGWYGTIHLTANVVRGAIDSSKVTTDPNALSITDSAKMSQA